MPTLDGTVKSPRRVFGAGPGGPHFSLARSGLLKPNNLAESYFLNLRFSKWVRHAFDLFCKQPRQLVLQIIKTEKGRVTRCNDLFDNSQRAPGGPSPEIGRSSG